LSITPLTVLLQPAKPKTEVKKMPNWVNNTLKVIKGDPKEIFEFVRSEKSIFDFNKLIPMPESIWNSDQEVTRPSGFKVPAWFAWSLDNWGCKWNAAGARYSTNEPHTTIWFDTPWDPPVPVFEALAKHFPKHEIVIYSDEYINHVHDTFTLKQGELTWTVDPCRCYGEDDTSLDETPLTKAELEVFGIEEAP
jgi:Ferredoxin-like domain in Api92-like protein